MECLFSTNYDWHNAYILLYIGPRYNYTRLHDALSNSMLHMNPHKVIIQSCASSNWKDPLLEKCHLIGQGNTKYHFRVSDLQRGFGDLNTRQNVGIVTLSKTVSRHAVLCTQITLSLVFMVLWLSIWSIHPCVTWITLKMDRNCARKC